MRKGVLSLIAACLPMQAMAEIEPERLARIETFFQGWLEAQGAKGTLAVMKDRDIVAQIEMGLDPHTPMELASLSKAITAQCAAHFVREGAFGWDDDLSDLLGRGPSVTLGALMTQTGGIGPDGTQMAGVAWLDTPDHRAEDILDLIEARGGQSGTPGEFFYNNENYALLSLAISSVAPDGFANACTDAVIAPAGVSAEISDRAGASLSWGGWKMTAADYARWMSHWYGTQARGETDAFSTPTAPVTEGMFYGTGMFQRASNQGNNFWHFGAWCIPGRFNTGSFAVTWWGEWTVVAGYNACVDWDANFALDQGLAKAVLTPLD